MNNANFLFFLCFMGQKLVIIKPFPVVKIKVSLFNSFIFCFHLLKDLFFAVQKTTST